jgi:hypothetical protein
VIVPSGFTTAVPFEGCAVIVTEAGSNEVPPFAALSFARTFVVVEPPVGSVATSLFATGKFVADIGSMTVISKGVVGQFVVWPGGQTGTSYTYFPGTVPVKV